MAYENEEAIPRGAETPNVYGPADKALTVQESQLIGSIRKNDKAFKPYTPIKNELRSGSLAGKHNVVEDKSVPCPLEYINAINALKNGATVTFYVRLTSNLVRTSFNIWLTFGSVLDISINNTSGGNLTVSVYSITPSAVIVDTTVSGANPNRYLTKDVAIEINPSLSVCKIFNISDANRKYFVATPIFPFALANLSNMLTADTTNLSSIYYAAGATFSVERGGYREDVFSSRARRIPQIPQQPSLPSKVGIPGLIEQSKRPWSSQPQGPVQIDWHNPITKSLVYAVNAASQIEAFTGTPVTFPTADGVVKRPFNNVVSFQRTSNPQWGFTLNPLKTSSVANSSDATLIYIGGFKRTTNTVYEIISSGHLSTSTQLAIRSGTGTNTSIQGFIYSGGITFGGSFSISDDNIHTIALQHKYGVGQTLWVDRQKDPNTGSFTGIFGGPLWFTGILSGCEYLRPVLLLKFDRCLSDSEIHSISQDPWQIFKPLSYKQFVGQNTLPNTQIFRRKKETQYQPLPGCGLAKNSLAVGIFSAWLPHTSPFYDATGTRGTLVDYYNTDSFRTMQIASNGEISRLNNNSNLYRAESAAGSISAGFTNMIVVEPLINITSTASPVSFISGASSWNANEIWVGRDSTPKFSCRSVGGTSSFIHSEPYEIGKRYVLIGVSSSSGTSFWINGVKVGSNTDVFGNGHYRRTLFVYSPSSTANVMRYITGAAWSRALSDSEVIQLSKNQYQIFGSEVDRVENRTPVKPQPLLPKYNPWASQPQQAVGIDWDTSITRGLVLASNPTSLSVIGIDGKEIGRWITSATEPGSPPYMTQIPGYGNAIMSTHDYADLTGTSASISNDSDISFLCVFVPIEGTYARTYMARGCDTAGAGWSFNISRNIDGTILAGIVLTSGGTVGYSAISNTVIPINTPVLAIATWSKASGKLELFVNGKKEAETATGGKTVMRSSTLGIRLGGAVNTIASYSGGSYGKVGLSCAWSRGLTEKEALSLSANPWQIFKPIKYPARLK